MEYALSFLFVLLVPVAVLSVGLLWKFRPPKMESTSPLAYRTALSTASLEAWNYAHEHCARLWIRLGIVLTILISGGMVALREKNYQSYLIWMVVAEMVLLCCTTFFVDVLLKVKSEEKK